MVVNREKPHYNHRKSTSQLSHDFRKSHPNGNSINQPSNAASQSVYVASEDEWHFIYQYVANDTTCRTCEHAHDIGCPERETSLDSLLIPHDGEKCQANSVEEEDCVRDLLYAFMEKHKYQQSQGGDEEVHPLSHPERAMTKHYIAKRTTTYCGCHAHDECAKPVEITLRCKSDSRYCKCEGTYIVN